MMMTHSVCIRFIMKNMQRFKSAKTIYNANSFILFVSSFLLLSLISISFCCVDSVRIFFPLTRSIKFFFIYLYNNEQRNARLFAAPSFNVAHKMRPAVSLLKHLSNYTAHYLTCVPCIHLIGEGVEILQRTRLVVCVIYFFFHVIIF